MSRETDGYLDVLVEMQRIAVDPNQVRQLLHHKKEIYIKSREDPKCQPEYLLKELRERAFQDDFVTHVFVRTIQRGKMAENVGAILESQLSGMRAKHENKMKEMREATLASFEAFNTEVILRQGEQHGTNNRKRVLVLF